MSSSDVIISTARSLFLKYRGVNHRRIEIEMRRLGHRTFTRRVFYGKRTERGYRPGWIERFGWRNELENLTAETQRRGEDEGTDPMPQQSSQIDSVGNSASEEKPLLPPRLCVSAVDPGLRTEFKTWLKQISPGMTWDWPYQELIYKQLEPSFEFCS